MERKTGLSGQDYMIIRDFGELRVEPMPVEMKPSVEYSLPRRMVERVMQRIPGRTGKR